MCSECPFCGNKFEAYLNRKYDFNKIKGNYKFWFIPAMKEFEKFQIVECPNCGREYKENNVKLFHILTPVQVLIIVPIFNILLIIFMVYYLF